MERDQSPGLGERACGASKPELRRVAPWPLIRSEEVGNYRIFRLHRDWRRSPRTGREHDFFVMHAVDWVNVIALTRDGHAVMVEQFRHGTATVDLEIPGGVMDPEDADPVATAVRELREETGYVGERARLIGSIAPNPAILSNQCHTVLIESCVLSSDLKFDPGEDIATLLISAEELPRLVAEGSIRHALVAVAIFHFELWRRSSASRPGTPS
ncbi:MAG: NUDIX hydrolase [Verrucomicrobiales bacterium]|nr:NUDIX hydrolase [Verrucomicrobiales bacterium]